jgi:hypothetical protein
MNQPLTLIGGQAHRSADRLTVGARLRGHFGLGNSIRIFPDALTAAR